VIDSYIARAPVTLQEFESSDSEGEMNEDDLNKRRSRRVPKPKQIAEAPETTNPPSRPGYNAAARSRMSSAQPQHRPSVSSKEAVGLFFFCGCASVMGEPNGI